MFNKKDFNHIDKMNNEMADGVINASQSTEILEKLLDILRETDFESDESRMGMMMHCINICYEKEDGDDVLIEDNVFHLILGLCFLYSNVISNLIIDGFDIPDYFRFLKEEVIPSMREEYKTLPYWDIDDE